MWGSGGHLITFDLYRLFLKSLHTLPLPIHTPASKQKSAGCEGEGRRMLTGGKE